LLINAKKRHKKKKKIIIIIRNNKKNTYLPELSSARYTSLSFFFSSAPLASPSPPLLHRADAAAQKDMRRADERQERAARNLVQSFAFGAPGVGVAGTAYARQGALKKKVTDLDGYLINFRGTNQPPIYFLLHFFF
jgi:hypothetical protein